MMKCEIIISHEIKAQEQVNFFIVIIRRNLFPITLSKYSILNVLLDPREGPEG